MTFEMVALKLEAAGSTEMLIPIRQTTLHHIQEDYLQQEYTVISLPASLSVFNAFIAPTYALNFEMKQVDMRKFFSE